MTNFDEIERITEKYIKLKQQKKWSEKELEAEFDKIRASIIDYLSSPEFEIPLEREGVVSSGTTTYIYKNNSTYPNLFEFISQMLHRPIPIVVGDAKLGPGEVIVNRDNKKAARGEISHCVTELRKLIVHSKS